VSVRCVNAARPGGGIVARLGEQKLDDSLSRYASR